MNYGVTPRLVKDLYGASLVGRPFELSVHTGEGAETWGDAPAGESGLGRASIEGLHLLDSPEEGFPVVLNFVPIEFPAAVEPETGLRSWALWGLVWDVDLQMEVMAVLATGPLQDESGGWAVVNLAIGDVLRIPAETLKIAIAPVDRLTGDDD